MDNRYTSVDQLPMMLTITETSRVLGISRAATYQLAKSSTSTLPVLHIGTRLMVPRDSLLEWIATQTKR